MIARKDIDTIVDHEREMAGQNFSFFYNFYFSLPYFEMPEKSLVRFLIKRTLSNLRSTRNADTGRQCRQS